MSSIKTTSLTIPLPPHATSITYTPKTTGQKGQQPHTTPIAHFASTPNSHPTGSLVAISESYICYAVKGGLVRVIDRNNALRCLLRGHTKRLTDLSFFPSSNSTNSTDKTTAVLGTVGGEGDAASVLIWRIFPSEQQNEISTQKLLEIRYKLSARLIWNPFDPNSFLLVNRHCGPKGVAGVILNSMYLQTKKHETEDHPVCICDDDGSSFGDKNQVKVLSDASLISDTNDVSQGGSMDAVWSIWSKNHVFITVAGKGFSLWSIPDKLCVWSSMSDKNFTEETTIDNIMIVAGAVDVEGSKSVGYDRVTEPFITGAKGNTEISLWSGFKRNSSNDMLVEKLRVFKFGNPASSIQYRMAVCNYFDKNSSDIPRNYVILADKKSGNLYAVHIALKEVQNERMVAGFDSVTPFEVMHPILSWFVNGEMVIDDQEEVDDDEENGSGEKFEVSLFCVQTKAVQLLKLKPKMMRRPKLENDTDVSPDVTVEYSNDGEKNDAFNASNYEYEEDEESFDDDESNEDDEEEEDGIKVSLPAAPLPPPGLMPLPDAQFNKPPDANPVSSFANWLGSIVPAKNSESLPDPIVSSSSSSRPIPAAPPGLESIISRQDNQPKTANPPSFTPFSSQITAAAELIQKPVAPVQQEFLSPMQLLSNSSRQSSVVSRTSTDADKEEDKFNSKPQKLPSQIIQQQEKTPQTKIEPQPQVVTSLPPAPTKKTSSRQSGQSKSPKRKTNSNDSKSKKQQQPQLNAQKITLLKREQNSNPSENVKSAPVSSATPSFSSAEMEDVIKRTLEAQFKLNETFMSSEFQRCLKSETKTNLVPSLTKSLSQGMEQNITKSLQSTISKNMKEREKKLIQDVSNSVGASVREPLVTAFRESMREVLVPAFEAATQQMFSQVSNSVSTTLANTLESSKKNEESLAVVDKLTKDIGALTMMVQQLSAEVASLKNVIQSSQEAVMSAGQTAGPHGGSNAAQAHHDPILALRDEIVALLSQLNYEHAFNKALSANSPDLAFFTCQRADISRILDDNNKNVLSQPILLCLMQQLGSALKITQVSADVSLIASWLQDIAVTINPYDASISAHVQMIMNQVTGNIRDKLNDHDDAKLRRKLQTLLQVIRGIGN